MSKINYNNIIIVKFIMAVYTLQLNRQLDLLSRRQVLPSLGTVLKQWTNLCEKPPTGFEKYFDKDKKGKDEKKSGGSARKPFEQNAFKRKMSRISQG